MTTRFLTDLRLSRCVFGGWGCWALAIAATFVVVPGVRGGVIRNGEFNDGPNDAHEHWGVPAVPSGFPVPLPAGVGTEAGNRFAVMELSDPIGPQLPIVALSQTFQLPGDARELLFDYRLSPVSDGGGGFPDTFTAMLGFPGFNFDAFPGFFGADNRISPGETSNEFFDEQEVSVTSLGTWRRVAFDLTSLSQPLPAEATLTFLGIAGPDNTTTTISIDNVRITQQVIPEPGALAIWAVMGMVAVPFGRRAVRNHRHDRK